MISLIKALSLECLENWIVQDTPHNRGIIERIDEMNDEFEKADPQRRISLLARVYDLVLTMDVI